MRSLGQRIREERQKQNLTLEQLSQLIELPERILSRMKRDVGRSPFSNLRRSGPGFYYRERGGKHLRPCQPSHFKGIDGKRVVTETPMIVLLPLVLICPT